MEQEIRNADLSDMMCDLLYLLGRGVNEKMPAKAYIKTFQEAYDEDKMQMMYRFCKAHFVEALTGTVLKKAGVKLPAEWEVAYRYSQHRWLGRLGQLGSGTLC